MGEPEESTEEPSEKELEGKKVAYYSVLLSARVQNNMERDKALMALSLAAIGFLVAILNGGNIKEWFEMVPFLGAFVGFGACIKFVLTVFKLNAEYIDDEIKAGGTSKLNLSRYDRLAERSFLLGLLFLCAIGLNFGLAAIAGKQEGAAVGEKAGSPRTMREGEARESVQGLGGLHPMPPDTARPAAVGGAMSTEKKVSEADMQKSLSGLADLKPGRTQNQNQSENQSTGRGEGKK